MSWYSENGVDLKERTLLELYKSYQANARMNLELVYKYRDYFIAAFAALISVFVAVLVEFYKQQTPEYTLALIPIPALIFYLCYAGKSTTSRYYKHFLESIVVVAKIENILGIDCPVKFGTRKIEKLAWPDDKQLVVDRYHRAKYGTSMEAPEKSSKEFIESRLKKGDIVTSHHIFSIFQIVSIILIVMLVVLQLVHPIHTIISI
jgi:hypothetical protein